MSEEQFVNIDLNDDNVCSICKLGTERETLSFCHICFELNIEGKCTSAFNTGSLFWGGVTNIAFAAQLLIYVFTPLCPGMHRSRNFPKGL